jgi:hypothetical protein
VKPEGIDYAALKEEFYRFCNALTIQTKELGEVKLGPNLLGTQRYFFDEVFAALARGIHWIVILKGRQLGISTACLALDLFWAFKFPGMQSTLATDTEDNRESFRTTLDLYMDGLPQRWRQPAKTSNRVHMVFANHSRIAFQVAGTRKNVGFGAGKAITMMHATEVGKWGEGTDLESLEASLAETNPHRLYIWESTAYGFNAFQEMWDTAEDAETQAAVFVGWWRNELYALNPDGDDAMQKQIYDVYWDGQPTNEEQKWIDEVRELYDFEITPGQIAWWRWSLAEKMRGDDNQMYEKYPPTAEYAFVMTGSSFFSVQRLTDQIKIVRDRPFTDNRFVFGPDFEDTEIIDCKAATSTLRVWQHPVMNGQYVVGADPAWGSSEWADRFAINVSRCWADGVEQVAEFCTEDMNTMQFAWVLLYLAGAYGDPALHANVMINLEINGPGRAVWAEIQSLKTRAHLVKHHTNLSRLLQNIQNFLYSRPDALGRSFNYHTQTTNSEKERMLGIMRDHHEYGSLVINSEWCLAEMKNVVRKDGQLGAPGRGKDDRVIAQGLAMLPWNDFIRTRLIQMGITREKQRLEAESPKEVAAAGRTIGNYLKAIGLLDKGARTGPPP